MAGLQIDRTKTAAANLHLLILTASTFAFTGSEFTISPPSSQTPVDPQEATNSQITLTAVNGSGFVGTKTLRYARLALGATRPGAKVAYTISGADTLSTLKAAIAVEHNLVETDFDLAGTLPAQGAAAETFTLTASANSYLYTGSTTVTVTYP